VEPKDRLIFPLDVPDRDKALRLVDRLWEHVGLFKVGWELFMAEGPRFFRDLAHYSPVGLFLDLKLFDIPATVIGALRQIAHGAVLTTVHCDIGLEGLKKLGESLNHDCKVLAVTLLTSLSPEDLAALGYDPQYTQEPPSLVVLKARLAKEAGCHGVVCSGREVEPVKEACGQDFLAVCPGIRPEWAMVPGDDQRRTVTPYEAIKNGGDYIVVGRPIRQAADPVAAARRVAEEIAAGLQARVG
jgi:orotidine-5'-phosphate decarboxylase